MTYGTCMTNEHDSQQRGDIFLEHGLRPNADIGPDNFTAAIQHVSRWNPLTHIVASERRRGVDHPYRVVYAVALHERGHRRRAAGVSARCNRVDRDANNFQTLIAVLVLKGYETRYLHATRPAPGRPKVEYHYLATKCFEALLNVFRHAGGRRYRDWLAAATAACHHRAADNHHCNDQHQTDQDRCALASLRIRFRS